MELAAIPALQDFGLVFMDDNALCTVLSLTQIGKMTMLLRAKIGQLAALT
jgi:hypothetical protein